MQKDSADPLDGWSMTEIQDFRKLSAFTMPDNDIYGHLYFYLQDLLGKFCTKVRTLRLNVVFTATNAVNLHELVPGMTFDRIDVSNIMDAVYLGVPTTLESVRPLLRPDSKYATVISLFMNAIGIMQQKNRLSVSIDTLLKASQFLPVNPMQLNPHDPKFLRMSASQDMLVPFDAWFKEYMEIAEFKEAAREFQMMMKSQNTIIQKWPYRLKKKLGETGAQDEFDKLLASSWTGAERYVEWRLS